MVVKDAFDRWWEWAEKPADSTLTIPAHLHQAVMQLSPEQRRDRAAVNGPSGWRTRMRSDEADSACPKVTSKLKFWKMRW